MVGITNQTISGWVNYCYSGCEFVLQHLLWVVDFGVQHQYMLINVVDIRRNKDPTSSRWGGGTY